VPATDRTYDQVARKRPRIIAGALSRASASCAKTTKAPALRNKIRGMLADHRIDLQVAQSSMTAPVPRTRSCFILAIFAGSPGHLT